MHEFVGDSVTIANIPARLRSRNRGSDRLAGMATLTRRQLMVRGAKIGSGVGALLLVGCGESEEAPPRGAAAAPGAVQDQVQGADRGQAEPDPDAGAAAVEAEAAEQVEVQEAQQQVRVQEVAEQQNAHQVVQQVVGGRRRLVPDAECGSCSMEEPEFAPLAGARAEWGVIEGAGYRIEVPDEWNGSLVLWAHGFSGLNESGTGPTERLSFSMPVRELVIGLGYGWATSTYRVPGYVPGVGVDDLLLVKDRVGELFGAPLRTFCAGGSMGGATAQLMAQEFAEELSGALAFCGALGNVWVVDYLAAWHTLAMWFIGQPPERLDADGLVQWGSALGQVDAAGRLELTGDGERFAAVIEELTGGPRWAFREGLAEQWERSFEVGALTWPTLIGSAPFAAGEVIELGDAEIPFDTTGFEFGLPAGADRVDVDVERLNAEVVRVRSGAGRRRDPGVGAPSGRLEVPLLCLKTTGDLYTPIHLDGDYQRLVEATGDGEHLAMRAVRRAGHCNFTALEAAATLSAMVSWVEFGTKPLGEDLRGDLEGAGVDFTLSYDQGDPLSPVRG